jgi:hypothetical protein
MTVTLDRWAQRWDADLDLVLGEAVMQVDERLGRPRARRTEEFLRSIAVGAATIDAPEPNSRVLKQLNGVRGELHTVARRAFELCTGEPLEKLVGAARRAGTTDKTAANLAKVSEASAKATKAIKAAVVLDATLQIADAVLTVATIIETERRQQELDAERHRERQKARDRIERNAAVAATDVVNGIGGEPGWRARADAALKTLRERLGLTGHDTAIDQLLQQVAAQQQLVTDLRALLAKGAQHSAGSK